MNIRSFFVDDDSFNDVKCSLVVLLGRLLSTLTGSLFDLGEGVGGDGVGESGGNWKCGRLGLVGSCSVGNVLKEVLLTVGVHESDKTLSLYSTIGSSTLTSVFDSGSIAGLQDKGVSTGGIWGDEVLLDDLYGVGVQFVGAGGRDGDEAKKSDEFHGWSCFEWCGERCGV